MVGGKAKFFKLASNYQVAYGGRKACRPHRLRLLFGYEFTQFEFAKQKAMSNY